MNSLKVKSSRGRTRSTACDFARIDSDARITGKSDSSFERACTFREVCKMFLVHAKDCVLEKCVALNREAFCPVSSLPHQPLQTTNLDL